MDRTTATPLTIHVVVFRQAGRWEAQCIEVNIAVSAAQRADLPRVLTRRIQGQILVDTRSGVAPLSRLGPANPRYRKMLESATPLDTLSVPEPLKARLLKLIRRLDWPAPRLELAAVGG